VNECYKCIGKIDWLGNFALFNRRRLGPSFV
jgi:hypothetical protein